jgi:hypothetical protein
MTARYRRTARRLARTARVLGFVDEDRQLCRAHGFECPFAAALERLTIHREALDVSAATAISVIDENIRAICNGQPRRAFLRTPRRFPTGGAS